MRQSYLVCYDICDDKRLPRVFQTMRGYRGQGEAAAASIDDLTLIMESCAHLGSRRLAEKCPASPADPGAKVCVPCESGYPTSIRAVSGKRPIGNLSRLPPAPAKKKIRTSSTPSAALNEARRDLDGLGRQGLCRQTASCRDSTRRPIRRHRLGNRLLTHDGSHRSAVVPPPDTAERGERAPRSQPADGRQDHDCAANEARVLYRTARRDQHDPTGPRRDRVSQFDRDGVENRLGKFGASCANPT